VGKSQTLLIVGEGGVEKTRRARLAAEEAARRKFAEGRAYSVESSRRSERSECRMTT
jgi:hypothetical protein